MILSEFKKRYPNKNTYENADEWIRKSYSGGWCYLVAGKENKIYTNVTTADVNSLAERLEEFDEENYQYKNSLETLNEIY